MSTKNRLSDLEVVFGKATKRVREKRKEYPNAWLRDYVRSSTLIFIASYDSKGNCALISPRGGKAGFMSLIEDLIQFKEVRGNNLFETISALDRNSSVAAALVVPGMNELVRLRGDAKIVMEEQKKELTWKIKIEEWYYHCGKSIKNSGIFLPSVVEENSNRKNRLTQFARRSDEYS